MNKFLLQIITLCLLSANLIGQVKIQGTIADPTPGGNLIRVYAKNNSSSDLSNVLFGNINLTFSIVDQGASNPTEAQITKTSLIPSLDLLPTNSSNPYIIGGRAYYSYLMNNINSVTTTTTWLANSKNNPVAEFTFPINAYFSSMRLDDVSPAGGPNGQMYWYVQVNGPGDVTDETNLFYGSASQPPTNVSGRAGPSFVPLQTAAVLPVKFLNFTASKSNNTALLNWAVENEDAGVAGYTIESSLNGIDFLKVASVNIAGNGRSSNSYYYIQNSLSSIVSSGIIYYRILQNDKSGTFVYSDIKKIRLDGKSFAASLFPNPVKGRAMLSFDLVSNAPIIITVNDMSGKKLQEIQVNGLKGLNTKTIEMGEYAAGSYVLQLQAGNDVKTIPVIKSN